MSAATRWFDFHIHSRSSDGAHSPKEILNMARAAGLEGISITDHDTLDAYRELKDAGLERGGNGADRPWILTGVEISSRFFGHDLHVLGYFPDGISEPLSAYVEEVLRRRRARIQKGIVKLRERGVEISWEECARLASGRVVSRNHLARVLVEKRYAGRLGSAYRRWLGEDVVPLPEDRAEDVVRRIQSLGGISVWAHPRPGELPERLSGLLEAGLMGVETVLPRRSSKDRRQLAAEARRRGLLVTGGSDWHGGKSPAEFGRFRVGESSIAEFMERIGR